MLQEAPPGSRWLPPCRGRFPTWTRDVDRLFACRISHKGPAIAYWLATQLAAFDWNSLLIRVGEVGGWSWPMVRGTEEGAPFKAVDLYSQSWGSHWRISQRYCAQTLRRRRRACVRLRARCIPTLGVCASFFRVLPVIPWKWGKLPKNPPFRVGPSAVTHATGPAIWSDTAA